MFERERWSVLEKLLPTVPPHGLAVVAGTHAGGICGVLAHAGFTVVGFDRFEDGLTTPTEEDGHHNHGLYEGLLGSSFAVAQDFLREFPVVLVKGDVQETLNTEMLPPVSFALVDLDLYAPTLHCLKMLYPALVPGGVILIDDWDWLGVNRALEESGLPFSPDGYLAVIRKEPCEL